MHHIEKDNLPESSLNSSHLLFPPALLLSSEEELETLESSEDDSSELDSFAAQKRDMFVFDCLRVR
jgi:hypothetical protein